MRIVFIIGTAGSGKSLLTAAYAQWLRMSKQEVATVNLDPGASKLPYSPDVDIRDYVDIAGIMEEHSLGPNGALIMAADLIADQIQKVSHEIEDSGADICLVDTSGQMELFAFRESGPYIVNELGKETKAMVYLFDAVFSVNPLNFVSNLFLSAAVHNRFLIPQVHVLSKTDLLPKEDAKRIVDWSASQKALETDIDQNLEGTRRMLSRDMTHAIYRLGLRFLLIPISAKTNDGMNNLNAFLERILAEGEKFTY